MQLELECWASVDMQSERDSAAVEAVVVVAAVIVIKGIMII